MSEGRISEPDNMTTEISKTEKRKLKNKKFIKQNIQKLWDHCQRYNIHVTGLPKGKGRQKGVDSTSEAIMTENIPHINVRQQTTNSGSSDNTRQKKRPLHLAISH